MTEQNLVLGLLMLGLLAAFVLYPALMFRLAIDLVRGIWSLVVDAFALLLTWI